MIGDDRGFYWIRLDSKILFKREEVRDTMDVDQIDGKIEAKRKSHDRIMSRILRIYNCKI